MPPDRDPVLFAAWLDAAIAGDREGLKILDEPVPMIELLERLSVDVDGCAGVRLLGRARRVFGFLAWPYVDTAKAMAEAMPDDDDETLPPAAAAAVAALIAEEQILHGRFDLVGNSASSSVERRRGAPRDPAPRGRRAAEGAIAGSTSAPLTPARLTCTLTSR